jgi:hypothetical protein
MKGAQVFSCAAFSGFSDGEPPVWQLTGVRIRAVKKPGRSLLSRAAGKLEQDNLFGIRKWNLSCTKTGAKTFQKLNIEPKIRK